MAFIRPNEDNLDAVNTHVRAYSRHDGQLMWGDAMYDQRSSLPTRAPKRVRTVEEKGFIDDDSDFATPPHSDQTTPGLDAVDQRRMNALLTPVRINAAVSKGRLAMQTGCIPCLIRGIACNPSDPTCRLAMLSDRNLSADSQAWTPATSNSLTLFRPDTSWRRSWRERHSLNFFVNFSAPQMAGFFDSSFWQRMVIQTSYQEPAILHAITAIGALHECMIQRTFADEMRRARATEFALAQCNKAISCLTTARHADAELDLVGSTGSVACSRVASSKLALITCVLFTCFEAMQGRSDSAVSHALQGQRLLQAAARANLSNTTSLQWDDLEPLRPVVERLEVQATALLAQRPQMNVLEQIPLLPAVDYIFSLDHAHNTLQTALNSIMRFMQHLDATMPPDALAVALVHKHRCYAPWFAQWIVAFRTFLCERGQLASDMDIKRARVLETNHIIGTILCSVDPSAGPGAYDSYEADFRNVIDLSRDVLTSYSCPPVSTLTGGSAGAPFLSLSLWLTDPLWMALSRCRNSSIRQTALTLLSQNPRQEGIWHGGPQPSSARPHRKTEPAAAAKGPAAKAFDAPLDPGKRAISSSEGEENG